MHQMNAKDRILCPEGLVELFIYERKVLKEYHKFKNIILWQGRAEMVRTMAATNPALHTRVINRMAIGDRGTIPLDSQVPKVPTPDLTGLYNEIYRKDIESKTFTTSGADNYVQFVAEFVASDVPLSAFSNPTEPRVNEVGLVFINPGAPEGLDRSASPVIAPDTPPADEVLASIRTFKSIPFDAANDVSVTVRYTLYIA